MECAECDQMTEELNRINAVIGEVNKFHKHLIAIKREMYQLSQLHDKDHEGNETERHRLDEIKTKVLKLLCDEEVSICTPDREHESIALIDEIRKLIESI